MGLVETGHVRTEDRDGTRIYSLTEAGQRTVAAQRSNTRWIILAVHGVYAFVMKAPEEIMIERERREVSTSTGRA